MRVVCFLHHKGRSVIVWGCNHWFPFRSGLLLRCPSSIFFDCEHIFKNNHWLLDSLSILLHLDDLLSHGFILYEVLPQVYLWSSIFHCRRLVQLIWISPKLLSRSFDVSAQTCVLMYTISGLNIIIHVTLVVIVIKYTVLGQPEIVFKFWWPYSRLLFTFEVFELLV